MTGRRGRCLAYVMGAGCCVASAWLLLRLLLWLMTRGAY